MYLADFRNIAKKTNRFLLGHITEHFTRLGITRALPNAGANEIAKFLLEDVIFKQGELLVIIGNRGQIFQSKVVSKIIKILQYHTFNDDVIPSPGQWTCRMIL